MAIHTTPTAYKQEIGRLFLDTLKGCGIDFAVLIPDTVLLGLDELLLQDTEIETMVCAREDEGIGIAFGAGLVGRRPVVLMEGSGLGLSSLILARGILHRWPLLILSSHNSVYAERYSYHGATRLVAQPTLDMLRIPYHVLMDMAEAPRVLPALTETMMGQKVPVALVVPRHVVMEG